MVRPRLSFVLIILLAWSLVGCVVTGGGQVGATFGLSEEGVRSSPPPPEGPGGLRATDFIEDR